MIEKQQILRTRKYQGLFETVSAYRYATIKLRYLCKEGKKSR